MAKYVCTKLIDNTCTSWIEYQSSVDMLAITKEQAFLITFAILSVWFSAWGIRQVLNLILRRRY